MESSKAALRLSPPDNVVVALRALKAGESVTLDDVTLTLSRPVATGHKLAARAIAEGELVIKYGCPIGVAARAIAPGEPVHTHNMKSDYRSPLILAT